MSDQEHLTPQQEREYVEAANCDDYRKVCAQCKVLQPADGFYKYSRNADGLHSYCRICQSANSKKKWLSDPEKARAACRNRRVGRTLTEEQRKRHNQKNKRYRDRYPEKIAARAAVKYALRTGAIQRQPCERCGAKAEAHHDDYGRPLDVKWLCRLHHAARHLELKAEGREKGDGNGRG